MQTLPPTRLPPPPGTPSPSFLLSSARVIFCTVSAVGSQPLTRISPHVPCVVVDEAAQLPEAEAAVILARFPSLRQWVLVGDPRQLPATVLSRTAQEGGYGRSAFERLLACGWEPVGACATRWCTCTVWRVARVGL